MYSQANVRAGKVLRPPVRALTSVIVVTEKVLREADGPVGRAALTAHFGWKGVRTGVRHESRSGEPVRSPKNTSAARNSFDPNEGRCSKNFGAKTKQNPTSHQTSTPILYHVKDEAKSDIASLRARTKHVLPYPSRGTFSSQMRGLCKFTLMPSSTPSSEDDVLSQQKKR